MRIDNWPMDRIMRLPDWCFGRRWFVGAYQGGTLGVIHLNMTEEELPDKFVVWGAMFSCMSPNCLQALRCTIRLGSRVPVNVAEALSLDRVFKGMSSVTIVYEFHVPQNGMVWMGAERVLIESAGRRVVIVTNGDGAIDYEATVSVLISALPKEVPDWLTSGSGANQY